MNEDQPILLFDKPHFVVKLHETLLEMDLKEGSRKKIEDFVESNPHLRESIGLLFQNIIPLDVELKNIDSVVLDDKGHVKVAIPHRRDITIPLEGEEANMLIAKLNELIPIEKQKEAERIRTSANLTKQYEEGRAESTFIADESERFR